MPRLVVLVLAVLVAAVTAGCISSQSPEERAAACRQLADDVALVHLSGEPEQESAQAAANKLDSRLSEFRDPSAHDAAVNLHASLHALARALERADTERADKETEQAREAANDAAKACKLSPAEFGV